MKCAVCESDVGLDEYNLPESYYWHGGTFEVIPLGDGKRGVHWLTFDNVFCGAGHSVIFYGEQNNGSVCSGVSV